AGCVGVAGGAACGWGSSRSGARAGDGNRGLVANGGVVSVRGGVRVAPRAAFWWWSGRAWCGLERLGEPGELEPGVLTAGEEGLLDRGVVGGAAFDGEAPLF